MIANTTQLSQSCQAEANEKFLTLLPLIERYARTAFHQLRSEEREEAICEVLATAFCAHRRLAELGKLVLAYATPLARYGVARFWAGRRVAGKAGTGDIFSRVAQRRNGFCLKPLHASRDTSTVWLELLADNRTPLADAVAFRLDFRAWLVALKRRERRLVEFLAVGNTPTEAAQRFRVSRARVSQLRRQLQVGWQMFQGENPSRV